MEWPFWCGERRGNIFVQDLSSEEHSRLSDRNDLGNLLNHPVNLNRKFFWTIAKPTTNTSVGDQSYWTWEVGTYTFIVCACSPYDTVACCLCMPKWFVYPADLPRHAMPLQFECILCPKKKKKKINLILWRAGYNFNILTILQYPWGNCGFLVWSWSWCDLSQAIKLSSNQSCRSSTPLTWLNWSKR